MPYYPKSQVTTGLYSNGDLVLKSTNEPYYGDYYKTSRGKFFTGKSPEVTPSQELIIPSVDVVQSDDIDISYSIDGLVYNVIKNVNPDKYQEIPQYSITFPTAQDYEISEFQRYFCKKTNEILYLEIDKTTYDKLVNRDPKILWQLYQPFSLPWQISGDKETVAKTNRNIVLLTMDKFRLPQFNLYLRNDYLKFYK